MAGTLPVNINHLTRLNPTEMEAIFSQMVENRWRYESRAMRDWPARGLTGTNSVFNRYFGLTKIKSAGEGGVRPDADPTIMTRRGVVIDTISLARANVGLLNNVQADFSIIQEISEDHGKEHAIYYDQVHFGQLVKGAQQGPLAGVDSIPGGKTVTLAANAHTDPDALVMGIRDCLTKMRIENIRAEELVVYVGPEAFNTLLENDKLVSRDYTAQGADFAIRKIFFVNGVRIIETNGILLTATPAGLHHPMSNANNAYAYDITAKDAKVVAGIGHRKSLMPASNISLTSKIWYNDEELQWFVDSYLAFAVTWNRPDVCGAVFKA